MPTVESHIFTIVAPDLACSDRYSTHGGNLLRQDASIAYGADEHKDVSDQEILFYGPYIALDPGVYIFTFNGLLDGSLRVDFCHSTAHHVFKDISISTFAEPICLALTKRVEQFEIRGRKTDQLIAMRLDAIEVEHLKIQESV